MNSLRIPATFLLLSAVFSIANAATPWAGLFPEKLLTQNGTTVDRDATLGNKIVGIYFGARWCGPCQTFTPGLVNFRNQNSEFFEVVFSSSDTSLSEQLKYMKEKKMNFPAVQCRTQASSFLSNKFGIRGIPALVIISPKDGSVITANGRSDVTSRPGTCLADWINKGGITFVDPPSISQFTGATTILKGESVELKWKQSGASSLTLDPIGEIPANLTSYTVSPEKTTTYTLTATNEAGTVSYTQVIEVLELPDLPEPGEAWPSMTPPELATNLYPFGAKWFFYHPLDGIDPWMKDPDFYTTWMKPTGYDGEGFKRSGYGLLGYGRVGARPTVSLIGQPDVGKRYTAYFKSQFYVAADTEVGIEIFCDDGAVIYLDGVEIARTANYPHPDYFNGLTGEDAKADEVTTHAFGPRSVPAGIHTLAVSVHNSHTSSLDLGFDLRVFTPIDPSGGNAKFAEWLEEQGLQGLTESDQALNADPDKDGRPNLLEYALGGDPLTGGEQSSEEASADSSGASLTFIRVKSSVDSKLSYKVQFCPKLGESWQDGKVSIQGAFEGVDQSSLPDGKSASQSKYERVRATFVQDPANPVDKGFLRIQVSQD